MQSGESVPRKEWSAAPAGRRAEAIERAPGRVAPGDIGFRPVDMADLAVLTAWLGEPHVRRFYQKTPPSRDDVAAEYGPLIRGETPDICHFAVSDSAPFAYLQCYRNAGCPDWAAIIGADDGISLDLFIGAPAYLGRGYGRLMLGAYLRRVAFPHFAGDTRAYIAHEPANTAAIRCSRAVGFRPLRPFLEDGVRMLLLSVERPVIPASSCRSP